MYNQLTDFVEKINNTPKTERDIELNTNRHSKKLKKHNFNKHKKH